MIRSTALTVGLLAAALASASAKTIPIRIGHQTMCTDTYPAGVAVKGLHLLEKYLPHDGAYAGVKYDVEWSNYSSGAPITQMMLARKLDFGVMGDYPLVVNGARFQQTTNERSYLVALTNYNLTGAGNGIVVPAASPVKSVRDLEGKAISVPIGSAAWGMLFEMAQQEHIPITRFHVVNQDPMVGIASIATSKIAPHADCCPISEYTEFNGTGRMIYSGTATGIPYLHGIVVTRAFADKYPELVVAYIKALMAAQDWIKADPLRAATMMSKWTMIPKEVLYLYFSAGGYLNPDPTLKPLWIKTLSFDHRLLAKYAHIPALDMAQWVNQSFIKTAFEQMHRDYTTAVGTAPYDPKSNTGLPAELWIAGHGITHLASVDALLAAIRSATAAKQTVDAAYVYDHASGLKLFAQYAYYVAHPGQPMLAYMTAGEARRQALGGAVMGFAQALGEKQVAAAMVKPKAMSMSMSSN